MNKVMEFGEYSIEEVASERQFDFIVRDTEGYVCRLVPIVEGFGLLPLSLRLGSGLASQSSVKLVTNVKTSYRSRTVL
jgi:hypothetical protein